MPLAAVPTSREELRRSHADFAREQVHATFRDSSILNNVGSYPTFDHADLCVGKVLGEGGFCTVSEIIAFSMINDKKQKEVTKSRVPPPITVTTTTTIKSRPVKWRAASALPKTPEYSFENRLRSWESRTVRATGLLARLSGRKAKQAAALYEERIVNAWGLASAIDYLHKRNIIYRDIKPENIGFFVFIKIFDFGLAKELRKDLRNEDGTYNLTANSGSATYMAPEVANAKPYNATCDSYSFAILFWEMLSLRVPYGEFTPRSIISRVYNGAHARPPINEEWPLSMQLLLKNSWMHDLHERSTMDTIVNILRKECVRDCGGDESCLEASCRRSTFVMPAKGRTRGT